MLLAAVVAGLGLPAAATAFSPQGQVLAATTTSPQITMISIPDGSGISSSSPGYLPADVILVIGVNNTVTWTDNDNQQDANGYTPNHTVTANDNSFSSNSLSVGDKFTYTFTAPGTYLYHCNVHSWMHGVVTVKGTSAPVPEFPLPFAVLLVSLAIAAAAFAMVRHGANQLVGSKAS